MQRLGTPSLSHVLPSRTPTNIQIRFKTHRPRRPWPNREGVPLRNHGMAFEASTLLLDLDAEDSPYVRPYKEDIDGAPAPDIVPRLRALLPVMRRVSKFEKDFKINDKRFKTTARNKFSVWQISDYDILSVALDNPSTADTEELSSTEPEGLSSADTESEPTQIKNSIFLLFRWNGIPSHARDNFPMVIAYMRRRQQLAPRRFYTHDDAFFRQVLPVYDDMFKLERIIAKAIQTPQGCQLVSNCIPTLVKACINIIDTSPPLEMLSLLNNLIIKLESQKLPVSTSLLWLAYIIALRSRIFTTAQKYLKIIRGNGDPLHDDQVFEALEVLEKAIAPTEPENVESYIERNTTPQLLAIYGLLTGRVLGEELWQASLHDVIFKCRYRTLKSYVKCLARLGSFRTMWYIWHKQPKDAEGSFTSNQRDGSSTSDLVDEVKISTDEGAEEDASVLWDEPSTQLSKAKAFSIAMQEAIRTNSRLIELAQAPDFAHTANQFSKDCRLDIDTIVKSADIISTRNYEDHSISAKEVTEIFEKKSIQEAMLALQSYLSHLSTSHDKHDETSPPTQSP
ncbi:hypothetical protein F5Y06DRAFT_263156 [Hypoxylon sp. FL0890]|nr:hypothetical protein F5Y06DRAFT_263156 [Hypoxylon sp. FL0890]